MPPIADEAICIRHWDWSETSQTVSMFGREIGLFRAVAKGARREKAPFSGGLELLTRGEAMVILRSTGAMSTLTSWELRATFPVLRNRLPAHYAGLYMADLVHHSLSEADPHPALFDALVEALHTLSTDIGRSLLIFQWRLLCETGHQPSLHRDVATGQALAAAETYAFSPHLGGLIADGGDNGPGPVWRVRSETINLLRTISSGDETRFADEATGRAGRLLATYLREVLGRDLPTRAMTFPSLPRESRQRPPG